MRIRLTASCEVGFIVTRKTTASAMLAALMGMASAPLFAQLVSISLSRENTTANPQFVSMSEDESDGHSA